MTKTQFMIASSYEPPPNDDELPYDDGEELETPEHRYQMGLLIETIDLHYRDRPDVYVGGNMFIHYTEVESGKSKYRGPDFFAFVGDVTRGKRKSWVTWKEGGRLPDLIVELTSESTRDVDHIDKMRLYRFVWRTPEYVIFDPISGSLEAYRIEAGQAPYAAVTPDASGRVPSLMTGLTLGRWTGTYQGVEHTWLRFFDAAGALLPTEAEAALSRAEAADTRAAAADSRAEAERGRAEAERGRAEAERGRAEAALARAEALAAELEALRAAVRG